MSHDSWPWSTADTDRDAARLLCHSLGIQYLTAVCLARLGIKAPDAALKFLNAGLDELADPFVMAGMEEAVERLAYAVRSSEPVLVYGDYDADGVTATALLTRCFRRLGMPADYYLPERLSEGYGLQESRLRGWADSGGRLVVSVDCGSNDFAAIASACEQEINLIITDHHLVVPGERPVTAFINPRRQDCNYPDKELAGVGVAWNLVRALHIKLGMPDEESTSLLDLVAIGTIADVVELQGENRILVRHGLKKLCANPLPGIAALARRAGLDPADINTHRVAFALSPRLNAPGRLGDATPSLELLLADDEETADSLALELDESNRRRQQVEAEILVQAQQLAKEEAHSPALVLWHEQWHAGVVGIVAGRLAAEYARPVVLIALPYREGRGSARCVPGFDLMHCLSESSRHLIRFGGHKEAAGLTIDADKLTAFREDFCRSVAGFAVEEEKQYVAAAEVQLSELSLDLVGELAQLQPHGQGNPEPVFLARDVKIISSRLVGKKGNHLQLRLQKNSTAVKAIRFGVDSETPETGEIIDCAFTLQENNWQGKASISLHVRDMRQVQALSRPLFDIFDRRGAGGRDDYLARLAKEQRLLIFVNTRNAYDILQKLFSSTSVTVTHRGQSQLQGSYDALIFYHLPYDRKAVEQMLSGLSFSGRPTVHLLFGQEDIDLNERIFSAGIPDSKILQLLAERPLPPDSSRVAQEDLQKDLSVPLTRHLLRRSLKILAELGVKDAGQWPQAAANLNRSATYLEGNRILSSFRNYQEFWWRSRHDVLVSYLTDPESFSLPEGVNDDQSGRIERAN